MSRPRLSRRINRHRRARWSSPVVSWRHAAGGLEQLEARQMMHSDTPLDLTQHIHAELNIWINGVQTTLPANIGVSAQGIMTYLHTHDAGNVLHQHPLNDVPATAPTLGDFFTTWRTNAGLAGNNPDAIFNSSRIFNNVANSTHVLRMFVNGVPNTQFENYSFRDGDDIAIVYTENPLVTINTNVGSITMELLADDAPGTVANFLSYANDGDFTNSIFHRLAKNFVLQGGGFTSSSATFSNASQFVAVPQDAAIQNEYKLSNIRGTVAMAKLGGNPNSATNQWFINLADNSSNLNNQNGGFTVFARVVDMHVADEINQLTTTNAGGAFNTLPLTANNEVIRVTSVTGEGIVGGRIFNDTNGNFVLDSSESPQSGVVVYIDADADGVRDTNETSTVTDSTGTYSFTLPNGNYLIRQIVPSGFIQSAPVSLDNQRIDVDIAGVSTLIFANRPDDPNSDFFDVEKDSPEITLDVLANDSINGSNANLVITSLSTPTLGGKIKISADKKTVLYTPPAGLTGVEAFSYIFGNNSTSRTAIATVTISAPNTPPNAVDDAVTVDENSTNTTLQLLTNDTTTPDVGETLRITTVGTPSNGGTVTIAADGKTVRYSPAANFKGTETFTYTISDRATGGKTDTATVTVTVTDVNQPPTAVADTATVAEDATGIEIDLLANDLITPDVGETLSLTNVSNFSNGGTATLVSGTGKVNYRPAANFSGTETFRYTVTDSRGATATGTVTVTVTPVNDAPIAQADTYTFTKNTGPHVLDPLVNDSDVDGNTGLRIVAVGTGSQGGTLEIINNGANVRYAPASNVTGVETFTYTLQDASGVQTIGNVSVTVRNFVPSDLSGFVYFDVNNNGQKDSGELPIGGVRITLAGTDSFGSAINLATQTSASGAYKFDNLAPGTYTVVQEQPELLIDGQVTPGSQGGTAGSNQLVVKLQENTTGSNNNFGEVGREARLVSIFDALASAARSRTMAVVDSQNVTQWYTYSGLTNSTLQPAGVKVSDLDSVQLLATNSNQQVVAATVPANNQSQYLQLSPGSGHSFFQISGELQDFTYAPITTGSSSSSSSTLSSVAANLPPAGATESATEPTTASATVPTTASTSESTTSTVNGNVASAVTAATSTPAATQSTSVSSNPLFAALASKSRKNSATSTLNSAAVDSVLAGL